MAELIRQAEVSELNQLSQGNAYVWLLEIEVPTDPVARYRLNNSAHEVEWGTASTGTPFAYSPFPFQVTGVRRDANGSQTNVMVTASNVERQLQAAIENYDGLIGQPASLFLVNKLLLGTGTPLLEVQGEIITHRATARDISFEIGTSNLYRSNFPALRISPLFCSHKYGGILCGYDTTRTGALQTCDKTLDGTDGCRVHGDDEEAASLERQHPARWGAFPGVPRNRGGGG